MLRTRIDRRILVVGAPRSGTTLVQSLLATHRSIASFTESHFFSRHFRLLPPLATPVLVEDPRPRLRTFLAENIADFSARTEVYAEATESMPSSRLLMPFRTRPVARQLLGVLDRLALMQGRSTWIEKTPQHLRYIPFLERLSRPTRPMHFVHVIREGLEVASSLHVASQSWEPRPYPFARGPVPPYDLPTCAKRWNEDVSFSLGRVDSQTDHFVFYEDLTSHPEEALRRLLGSLDLRWEPEILEAYAETASRLIATFETWKGVDASLRRLRTSHRVLTAEQREQVSGLLDRHLYDQLHERTEPRAET